MATEAVDTAGKVDLCPAVFKHNRFCRAAFGTPSAANAVFPAHLRARGEARFQPANQSGEWARHISCKIERFARGHDEVSHCTGERIRVPGKLDLFPTGGAQPPLNRIRQHWNLLRLQADQMRHHQVEGIKTIPHSGSGQSDVPPAAAGRTVPPESVTA